MTNYNEKSIQRFAGLQGIRKKPTPYIGPNDSSGLFTILREPADNAVDQALAGRNNQVTIAVDNGSYWVIDSGEGIPVGVKEFENEHGQKEKLSTLYVATGLTHGGSNFAGSSISRGCFAGDTKVRLLNGKVVSMERLYSRWNKNQTPIAIMSYNLKSKKLEPSYISHVQLTKHTRNLTKVIFDTGESVLVTPDHPFFVKKGGSIAKVRAENLNGGDSLVTYYSSDIPDIVKYWNHTVTGVVSIHKTNSIPVYDITVDNTHTFFIEPGILVSNTHGLGQKATNAMSKEFIVWTCRDGKWYSIKYRDAKLVENVKECQKPKLPFGLKSSKGTVVKFIPDLTLFQKGSIMPSSELVSWAKLTSYLVPNFLITLVSSKGTKQFKSKGPQEYIKDRLEEQGGEQLGKTFQYSSRELDVAVAFCNYEGSGVNSYTNGLLNKDGGDHYEALKDSLFKSLVNLKKVKQKFTKADVVDGLIGLINYKIAAPKFNNQPKDKLIDDRVYPVAVEQLTKAWLEFWKTHKSMLNEVLERASLLRSKTADFLKDKKLVKNVNAQKKKQSAKFGTIQGKCPIDKRELILVEGDSAGGEAKKARDKTFQAIYPLKGKPLNVMEVGIDKINSNEEIVGLLAALDVDLSGKSQDIPYGKIILMSDADVDGKHIGVLLLGFLYKYLPNLFKLGKVYAVRAPLFKGHHKGKTLFGMTKEEVYKQAGTDKVQLSYLKGWGEISGTDLACGLKPGVRKLYKLQPPENADKKDFEKLLGTSPDFRKKLLGVA